MRSGIITCNKHNEQTIKADAKGKLFCPLCKDQKGVTGVCPQIPVKPKKIF